MKALKSLRLRLTVWFVLAFLLIMAAFTLVAYHALKEELHIKTWRKNYPEHPDWRLHGSYSTAEVRDIVGELVEASLLWGVPLVTVAAAVGYWLARKSLLPIASVNQQLQSKTANNLDQPITLPEVDEEFRDLLRQLNELLKRLDESFTEMNTYAAKVAHELRTPLAIMRLKVEQGGNRIAPELAGELEEELHRLTHVVDQSLLIARAEQGRVASQRLCLNLKATVADVVHDFQLLAVEEHRNFTLIAPDECWVMADMRHLRQIIHNLLTNALKHGDGDLTVRVKSHDNRAVLFVANFVTFKERRDDFTLGLGLRVVEALLRLEPDIQFRRRRGNGYYAARVSFPACVPVSGAERTSPSPASMPKTAPGA